jgi:peptidoglycan/LPS O-acetylase OafA/YrhL
MIEPVRFVGTGLIGLAGLGCSVWLWRQSSARGQPRRNNELLRGDRPWRRLGAAIVGFVSVIFFAGANFIDVRQSPRSFAWFWLLVLVLVLWLCGLAVVDAVHTYRLRLKILHRERRERSESPATPHRERT